ncbi:efflux RND transporter periplasmic adaptor subunit [Solitalea sp. MAHUQ-68]|uniref:Efflux RND transporter periplasmic adaptor subunit n=1 Tax=Solitalea agri TaxID=2953739 RepID=A0A9X2F6F3_9SPHI|nr:efflux RND transporter periplasmic adaptor subunit [Solitalea agri]MCO4293251.1 efflux RND transporter periplasmic adaptor subunit [Solitalea agri]
MKNSFIKNYWSLLVPVIVLIVALVFFFRGNKQNDDTEIGMVDAKYVDIAAEFPGRLDSLLVDEGDTVKKGQLLGILRTTEINAIREQAKAGIDAAKSQLQLLKNGNRPEVISSTNKLYQIAQEQYNLIKKTYERMDNLYQKEVISGQEKDIIFFKLQAAKKEMEIAKLNLELLEKGANPELINTSTAILRQAEQAYELTNALSDNTRIYAPADGIIATKVINEGEIVSIGYPMMTLQKLDSYFIRFNIRQNKINQLKAGEAVKLKIPGSDPEIVSGTVGSISPTLTFANWVPTKERGQFELRTFTVEIKLSNPASVKGIHPGMTASLQLP